MWSLKLYLKYIVQQKENLRISALVFLRVISLSLLFLEVAFCLCNRGIICLILCYFKQALLPVNNEIYLIPEKSLPTYHDLNRSSKAVIVEFRYFYFPIILSGIKWRKMILITIFTQQLKLKLWRDKATQVYLPAEHYFLPKFPEMINFVKIMQYKNSF